jgi:hypothetical protein
VAYRVAALSEIESLDTEWTPGADWKPVRRHFDIGSFGVNASVAREAGAQVIGLHSETGDSGTRHEELFYVSTGRARFTVGGEEIDAPAGTFVYVPDPTVLRGAVAEAPGTTVLAVGAEPGAAFEVSPWERKSG